MNNSWNGQKRYSFAVKVVGNVSDAKGFKETVDYAIIPLVKAEGAKWSVEAAEKFLKQVREYLNINRCAKYAYKFAC